MAKKEEKESSVDQNKETSPESINKITFYLKDAKPRSFSEDDHGEEFKSVAAEFEETQKNRITEKKVS